MQRPFLKEGRLFFKEEMIHQTETIAAIATAMNNSGIGIIRISGEDAFSVIRKIFRPAKEKDMDTVASHTVHYGTIMDGERIVDEVLVLIMRAPHTYTQAEAVIDVINAENDFALKSAMTQLKGSVSEKVRKERARLLSQIAYIEAALDDPEHIEMEGYGSTLLPILSECREDIRQLLANADDGRIMKEGIRTVILGKPNVGKSSLLNALLGQERAIVTDIAGTTRDALEESLRIHDVTLNVIDTAGIRNTEDVIEKIGVDKAKEYAKEADLIVFVVDTSRPLDEDDYEILQIIRDKKVIALFNKQDLAVAADLKTLKEELGQIPVIETSIVENTGLDQFVSTVREMFYKKEINFNDQVYITNARQKSALAAAEDALTKAMDSINMGMSEDFFTIDMMEAYTQLGLLIGETVEDDLADEIFSRFCMGK